MVKTEGKAFQRKCYPKGQFEAIVCLMGLLYLLDVVPQYYMMWPTRFPEHNGHQR